jgi:hypothetical protein
MDDKIVTRFGETHEQRVDRIINTYERCVKKMDFVYKVIFNDFCKPCIEKTVCGCCIEDRVSYQGPASEKLYKMATKNIIENIGSFLKGDRPCPALNPEKGCVIEIKPSVCVSTFCHWNKIKEMYDIDLGDVFNMFGEFEYILQDKNNISENGAEFKRIQKFEYDIEKAIFKISKDKKIPLDDIEEMFNYRRPLRASVSS